jgi:hypothetical protein
LEHWYSSCGDDFAPTCEHIPSVRQANLEKSRKPPKPAEVVRGRSLEIQARQMAPPQVATAPTLQRAPSPPWAARSHTVARPTSGHSVCSRVLWTVRSHRYSGQVAS